MLSLIDSLEIRNLVHLFWYTKKDSHKFSLQLSDFQVVPPRIERGTQGFSVWQTHFYIILTFIANINYISCLYIKKKEAPHSNYHKIISNFVGIWCFFWCFF